MRRVPGAGAAQRRASGRLGPQVDERLRSSRARNHVSCPRRADGAVERVRPLLANSNAALALRSGLLPPPRWNQRADLAVRVLDHCDFSVICSGDAEARQRLAAGEGGVGGGLQRSVPRRRNPNSCGLSHSSGCPSGCCLGTDVAAVFVGDAEDGDLAPSPYVIVVLPSATGRVKTSCREDSAGERGRRDYGGGREQRDDACALFSCRIEALVAVLGSRQAGSGGRRGWLPMLPIIARLGPYIARWVGDHRPVMTALSTRRTVIPRGLVCRVQRRGLTSARRAPPHGVAEVAPGPQSTRGRLVAVMRSGPCRGEPIGCSVGQAWVVDGLGDA